MRLEKLDILRGIAIFLMVIFHINYSLVYLFSIEGINFSETFWFIIGRVSAISFILVAGISFFLAEQKYKNKIILKYIKIGSILGIIAGMISLSTFFFFPDQYIRFGIIHFFAVSFILILFFRKLRYYNLLLAIFFIIYGFYFIPVIQNEYLYFLGLTYSGFYSADYYPVLPYFGFMLAGYVVALFLSDKNKLGILKLKGKNNKLYFVFEYMGKKSLIIYLIHQPIIILLISLHLTIFQ